MFTDPFFFTGAGTIPSELSVFITVALVVAIVGVLIAGRWVNDREGVRPVARYLGAMTLLTLFVTLFASFATVHAATDLMVNHDDRYDEYISAYESEDGTAIEGEGILLPVGSTVYDFSSDPTNDSNYAAMVASGLIALTTGGIFFVHARWRRRLMNGPKGTAEAADRTDRAFHLGACFVSALVTAVALTSFGYAIFQIAAPGIAIGGDTDVARAEAISEGLAFLVLAAAAGLIFLRNWNRGGLALAEATGSGRARR